jgi:hypothetical protein
METTIQQLEGTGELTADERRQIAEYNLKHGRTDGLFHFEDFWDDMARATTAKFTRMCEAEMKRLGISCPVVVRNVQSQDR